MTLSKETKQYTYQKCLFSTHEKKKKTATGFYQLKFKLIPSLENDNIKYLSKVSSKSGKFPEVS